MRKRDHLVPKFLRKDGSQASRSRSRSPAAQTPVSLLTAVTTPTAAPVPSQSTAATDENSNQALRLAVQRHLDKLSDTEKDEFQAASKSLKEDNLLRRVREPETAHAQDSVFRPQAERLSKFLMLFDRFMGGVAIAIQANPDLSAIVVGGIRIVIDLAIDFAKFFSKLTDMLCQFEDYLEPLAKVAQVCQDFTLVQETLANVYGDILDFCRKARKVFVGPDGKRRSWTSWRIFFRQQWEPFEVEFESIRMSMQHHVDVLRLAGQAQQLNESREAKMARERKDREDFLNWLSTIDFEKVHDDIYAAKHEGTGDWLIEAEEFQSWLKTPKSSLLWCNGKRE